MFKITTNEHSPENFLAGDFPIKRDYGKIKANSEIRRLAPLVQGNDGIEEASEETLDKFIGIAADIPSDDEVVYYMTGEFFGTALVLPDGVTTEKLKPICRKLSIFLR